MKKSFVKFTIANLVCFNATRKDGSLVVDQDTGEIVSKVSITDTHGLRHYFFLDNFLKSFNRTPGVNANRSNLAIVAKGFNVSYTQLEIEKDEATAAKPLIYQHHIKGEPAGKPRKFTSWGKKQHGMQFENPQMDMMIKMLSMGMVMSADGTFSMPSNTPINIPSESGSTEQVGVKNDTPQNEELYQGQNQETTGKPEEAPIGEDEGDDK